MRSGTFDDGTPERRSRKRRPALTTAAATIALTTPRHVEWSLLVSLGALTVSAAAFFVSVLANRLARSESRKSDMRHFLEESSGVMRIFFGQLTVFESPAQAERLDTEADFARRQNDALLATLEELNRLKPKAERWQGESFYPQLQDVYQALSGLAQVAGSQKTMSRVTDKSLSAVHALKDAMSRYCEAAEQVLRRL